MKVGDGVTLHYHSDSGAATVIAVSPSGKTATVQEDLATRTDSNGMSDQQAYSYAPDPDGLKQKIYLNRKGEWKLSNNPSVRVSIGVRRKYYEYSF